MSKSIPERWLDYMPCGDVIRQTPIMAFKVPLKETSNQRLLPHQQFTISSLLQQCPQLRYVVDLTNTNRYYSQKDFVDRGVRHEKVMIPGRQIPPNSSIDRFFKVMDLFMSLCQPNEIIGVHCTHGVNRTGYLICRYLVQKLRWNLDDALRAFEEARGHKIERPVYLNDLEKLTRRKRPSSPEGLPGLPGPQGPLGPPGPPPLLGPLIESFAPSSLRPELIMGPPGFASVPRRVFANGGSFPRPPPPPFGFCGFGPMAPQPCPPPPPHRPLMNCLGPRPRRFVRPSGPMGPPPLMPLPALPFHPGPFPARIPGPPRMPNLPPRLPMGALPPRMPPNIVPTPPPHPPLSMLLSMRNHSKPEQDFTADTFDEFTFFNEQPKKKFRSLEYSK